MVKAFDANNSDEEPALRQAIARADTPLAPLCDGRRSCYKTAPVLTEHLACPFVHVHGI